MLQIVENHILEQITIVIKEISDITNRKIIKTFFSIMYDTK
jgi:hypothetical protein